MMPINLCSFQSQKKQLGFTLVELLIAGFLGILLVGGSLQLFIGSNKNYQMQDGLASLQESGRFSLMSLKQIIQRGGYSEKASGISSAVDFSMSRDDVTVTSGDAVRITGDQLSIAYNVVPDNTNSNNRDCVGNEVADGKIINTISVNANNELICSGNGSVQMGRANSVSLASNVYDFQVQYGINEMHTTKSKCHLGIVSQYLNATSADTDANKGRVVSVRIGIMLETESSLLDSAQQKEYTLLDNVVLEADAPRDRKLRRIFQETIFMPNAMYAVTGTPQSSYFCH